MRPPPHHDASLVVHTCDRDYAGTGGSVFYKADDTSTHAMTELDNAGENNLERDQVDTFRNLEAARSTFTLAAGSSDGWCVDSIQYTDAAASRDLTVKLCGGGAWLDDPCTEAAYSGTPCGAEIVVDVVSGSVQKLYDGVLSDLCSSPPPPPPAVVDLDFTTGSLPVDVVDISETACPDRQSSFAQDQEMGTVYRVESGTGLYVRGITAKMANKVEENTEYTIRWVVKMDKTSGYNRMLNVNMGSDAGFYINGGANWYSAGRGSPSSPPMPANEWHSITITTGPDKNAAAYLDGGSVSKWEPHSNWDQACRIVPTTGSVTDTMMFFNDGGSENSCIDGGEHSGMYVKSIQVFNQRMSDAEVALLEHAASRSWSVS